MCTSKVYLTETKGILALKNKTKMENGFQYRSLKKKTQQCSSHHVRERKKTADKSDTLFISKVQNTAAGIISVTTANGSWSSSQVFIRLSLAVKG